MINRVRLTNPCTGPQNNCYVTTPCSLPAVGPPRLCATAVICGPVISALGEQYNNGDIDMSFINKIETVDQLKIILMKDFFRRDCYCLPGEYTSDNTYVLEKLPMDRFSIYYFERGIRCFEEFYDNESDAVNSFYRKIDQDQSTRG